MRILIPTDFSKLSKVAVQYAAKMSKKLSAELVLLHVVYIDAPARAAVAIKVKSIEDAMADNATQECIRLINETKSENKGKLNVSYKIIKGYPVEDVVGNFAHHNDISLIIMGTKGATGLKKVLMGSNATAVINNSDIPVITVPEFARFKNLKHMVYATDMTNLNAEMKVLVPLAKLFDATVHISHILSPESKKKIDIKKIIADVIRKMSYPKITFHILMNDDITEGIDEYIADTKADMLAMFTHNLTFFERLFGKSVTRQMAFQSRVPLLTIKK
jgi:nucleotide-binding universal stress UspA family protein